MRDLDFIGTTAPLTLAALAACAGTRVPADADPNRLFLRVAPIEVAGPAEVTIFEDHADPEDLVATRAGACFLSRQAAAPVPAETIALACERPLDALRRAIAILHPYGAGADAGGIDPSARVHPDARLEQGVAVEPFAVVGAGAEIGAGTSVGAYCAIGAGVRIGRGCVIGSHVTIAHALIGNGAMIHSGVRIGFDGPISDVAGREIVGRFGRVIVQDGVEIGANAAIARGGLRDTVIGERSLIGPLAALPGGTRLERGSRILGGGFSAARKMV